MRPLERTSDAQGDLPRGRRPVCGEEELSSGATGDFSSAGAKLRSDADICRLRTSLSQTGAVPFDWEYQAVFDGLPIRETHPSILPLPRVPSARRWTFVGP